MSNPNLNEEKKLWKKGYKYIACLDEVGRGCLAGPVMAAAVMIKISNFQFLIFKPRRRTSSLWGRQIPNPKSQNSKTEPRSSGTKVKKRTEFSSPLKIQDSKKLSSKKREEFYKLIIKNPQIKWGIGRISEKVIDKINILEATKLAMIRAIKKLERKPDFLIIDGNFKLNLPIPQKSIVKADEKVFCVALASIIAKVTRDRLMRNFAKKYSKYGFEKHKGYGTKDHLKMLKKFGPCKSHRLSFSPCHGMPVS